MSNNAGYLPRSDEDRVVWGANFTSKFPGIAAALGFTPADVTAVTNDFAMLAYMVNQVAVYDAHKQQRVKYKNLIKNGPIGAPGGVLPTAPPAGTVPTVVAPGIYPRLSLLVQRIKAAPNYTQAIGHDLGIIAVKTVVDEANMKPTLKLVMKGGQVEIQWTKSDSDGIRIEVDRGTGTWSFLAIDTVPHYTDTTPITAPATWKYRAMYLMADELVGQWSDVASIAVS